MPNCLKMVCTPLERYFLALSEVKMVGGVPWMLIMIRSHDSKALRSCARVGSKAANVYREDVSKKSMM